MPSEELSQLVCPPAAGIFSYDSLTLGLRFEQVLGTLLSSAATHVDSGRRQHFAETLGNQVSTWGLWRSSPSGGCPEWEGVQGLDRGAEEQLSQDPGEGTQAFQEQGKMQGGRIGRRNCFVPRLPLSFIDPSADKPGHLWAQF